MSYTANHGNTSGLKPSYSGQLDPYASPQKGLINTPYFSSSQGLEHQSTMLGALSGVPFVGKVASGYQKAVNAQIDRQFQEYMARLGFDFTNEQREKQNLYNYWVAQEFMDKQNQWNSYSNQVAEMKKAGLNPAGIFGEGQLTGNNSSQSAPTGGAPSGSATGIGYQSQTAVGDMSEMADFASAIKSISDAKLSDQQRADLLATATDRYKEIKENADKATYERQLAGMNAWILSEYGGKMKEADLKHMDALTQNLLAAAGLAIAQTGTEDEKQKKAMHEAWQAYMDWLERNHMYDAKLKLNYWYKSVENDIEQHEADIYKTQNEGRYAGVKADWLPYEAQTGRISANASAQEAYTHWQEYNNPRDLQGAIIRKIQNNPEGAGDVVMDVIENVGSAMLKRLDSTAKKLMLDHLKKDVQDYDSHPEGHTWFNDFIYDGKRRRIEDLEKGIWHR